MKYKSIYWWLVAFSYYFIMPYNKVKYKIFGYPKEKREIAASIEDDKINQKLYYNKLINKYPEFMWCEKYIDEDSFIVPDVIRIVGTAIRNNFISIWTYNGEICHIKKILQICPIQTTIYIKNRKFMHSILIIGLDLKKNVIIAHDPLGDYNSNYLIWYGACIEIDIEEYRSISTGDPFTLILNVPNKIFLKKIKKILNNVKIFVYP